MKAIAIKESNKDRINQFIKEVEGKARTRTVDYADIEFAINTIERTLGIPKCHMTGCRAKIDRWADRFPNAYKYTPYSTFIWIEKTASGWKLLNADRMPTGTHMFHMTLTDNAKEAIINSKEIFD